MWPMPDFSDFSESPLPDQDSRVGTEVRQRLLSDDRTRNRGIVVEVQAGVAILQGWVGDRTEREAAAAIAGGTPGVRDVVNRVAPADQTAEEFDEIVRALGDPTRAATPSRTPAAVIAVATVALLVPFILTSRWVGAVVLGAAGAVLIDRACRRRAR